MNVRGETRVGQAGRELELLFLGVIEYKAEMHTKK